MTWRERFTDRWQARLLIAVVVLSISLPLAARFSIGIDSQDEPCLPWRVYLIDTWANPGERGTLVAYRTHGLQFREDGTIYVKKLVGMPGDQYVGNAESMTINGQHWADLMPAIKTRLGWPSDAFRRDGRLMNDQYLLGGTAPTSYDSRYWGPVNRADLIGRAYPIW